MENGTKYITLLKKYWAFPALLAIFAFALWVRTLSLRFAHIPDIDVYFMIRQSLYLLSNGFHLPDVDVLRYYPTGISSHVDIVGTFYIPAMIFALISSVITIDFITYAKWIPAIFGALYVIPLYFIGKELKGKIAGVVTAFLYATSAAVMFRTSAGEYEKEAFSILFILIGIYYFIRAYKTEAILPAMVSTAAIILAGSIWGGIHQIYLAFGGVVGLLLLLNKLPRGILVAYTSFIIGTVIGDILNIIPTGSAQTINYLIFATILIQQGIRKYRLVKEEHQEYVLPALLAIGIIVLLVSTFFSPFTAGLLSSVKGILFFKHGVIGSTVAENAPGNWGNFETTMGVAASRNVLNIGGLANLFDLWLIGFIAVIYLVYKTQKNALDTFSWIGIVSVFLSLVAYIGILKSGGSATLQIMFLAGITISTASVLRRDIITGLMLFLLFSSMLSYISYIRLLILVAIYIMPVTGYLVEDISVGLRGILRSTYSRWWHKEKEYRAAFFGVCAIVVSIGVMFIFTNAATGYVFGNSLGPSYNDNWDQAMTFMKEQTPQESVILSWWDFGYWFQLKSGRATNLDGGNAFGDRNVATAQFFTGMMNETQQKFFIQKMGTTHILVDASMIGKYAAMSKIANYGRKIESYMFVPYSQARQTKNGTVLVYSDGQITLLVPFSGNNSISAPKLMTSQGEVYINKLCLPERVVTLKTPANANSANMCLMLTREQAILITEDISESVFHNLFFMDGSGLDYVTKVFDNGEVKIFEVDKTKITRESKEALQSWWKENGVTPLLALKT